MRFVRWLTLGGLFVFTYGMFYQIALELFFFDEFSSRLNYVAVDYFLYPYEVFVNIWVTYPVLTVISVSGIVLGAAYMLWALQKVFFGKLPDRWAGPWDPTKKKYKHDDLNVIELTALVPLAVIIIYLGIYPAPILDMMSTSVNHLIEFVKIGGQLSAGL